MRICRRFLCVLTALVFSAVCLAQESGEALYKQALEAKSKKQETKYVSLLKEAAARGWTPAVMEDAERELGGGRKVRIVNAEAMIRNLEKIAKRAGDPMLQARARNLLGRAFELGIYYHPDRQEALKNYLLAARLVTDAKLAAVRLFGMLGIDTRFEKDYDAASILLYSVAVQSEEQDKLIGKFHSQMNAYEKTVAALAGNGDPQAIYYLGTHYLDGIFFPLRKMKGLEYLKEASLAGDIAARVRLAEITENGLYNQPKDPAYAAKIYRRLLLHPETAVMSAERLIRLVPADKNPQEHIRCLIVLKQYQKALDFVEKGKKQDFSPEALYLQAKLYEQTSKAAGKFSRNEYARLLGMAVNAGSTQAAEELLRLQPAPQPEALLAAMSRNLQFADHERLYQTARLAILCAKSGKAKPQDALHYMELAANAGNQNALFILASAYSKGSPVLGVKPDQEKAGQYFERLLKSNFIFTRSNMLKAVLEQQPDNKLLVRMTPYSPVAAALLAKRLRGGKTEAASVLLNALASGVKEALPESAYEAQLLQFLTNLKEKGAAK